MITNRRFLFAVIWTAISCPIAAFLLNRGFKMEDEAWPGLAAMCAVCAMTATSVSVVLFRGDRVASTGVWAACGAVMPLLSIVVFSAFVSVAEQLDDLGKLIPMFVTVAGFGVVFFCWLAIPGAIIALVLRPLFVRWMHS